MNMDMETLATGILIFFARIADVSLGTVRTISIVQGRTTRAFFLGLVEVSIWLGVLSTVVHELASSPVLGIFYAIGFSTGNVAGIMVERWLASGHTVLRVISPRGGKKMARRIRDLGFAVTTFDGEGMSGPVTELYVVCRRRNLENLVSVIKEIEPDAFYITERAGSVSKMYRPVMQPPTGWRAMLKKK